MRQALSIKMLVHLCCEEKRKGKKCPKTKWMFVRPTSFSGDSGPLHQGNRVEEKLL
jgi:hypothetical protein